MPEKAVSGSANKIWQWKGYDIRYTAAGPNEGPAIVLVHGLFVNADHWRKTMPHLAESGYRVFALDMLGSGYSSKPSPTDPRASKISGENQLDTDDIIVKTLGTASGDLRRGPISVPQRHPVDGSVYNFYTWSEQISDFVRDIIKPSQPQSVAIICNSIGCISGLVAACAMRAATPSYIAGVFLVAPNFRELHVAEQPALARPFTAAIQSLLRDTPVGSALFNSLAKPDTVKTILNEPYYNPENVDDELVQALLNPLLLPGADAVVFDGLSYSAGPLPEQLLQDPLIADLPVYVATGLDDPWTPLPRVKALSRFSPVKRFEAIPNCGHCPHDERPDILNPLFDEFCQDVLPLSSPQPRQ